MLSLELYLSDRLARNIKLYGTPDLVNYNVVVSAEDCKFNYTDRNILRDIFQYFSDRDRDSWNFPAKNYFVRYCISIYISTLYRLNFWDVVQWDWLIPYDDKFIDKSRLLVYSRLINPIKVRTSPGYLKTIEIFKYLYQ